MISTVDEEEENQTFILGLLAPFRKDNDNRENAKEMVCGFGVIRNYPGQAVFPTASNFRLTSKERSRGATEKVDSASIEYT